MKSQTIMIIILVGIVTAGVGFFGGIQYQKSQRGISMNGQFSGRQGQGQQGARFKNGGGVFGQITSVDEKSITVKLMDGSSKIVILSGTTSINKQANGTRDDLKTGINVAVFGQPNSDGSLTAQNVQINPILRARTNATSSK